MRKKGITPLIATVLLIGFTVALAALVISWGSGLFRKTTSETGEISDFNILCTTGYNLEYIASQSGTSSVSVIAKNNNDKNVYGFIFVLTSDDGKISEIISTDNDIVKSTSGTSISPSGTSASLDDFKTIPFSLSTSQKLDWKTIDIRPIAILPNGKKQVCENKFNTLIN